MRILIAHSFYREPGGEDRYVRQQVELLRRNHDVLLLGRQNATIESRPDAATRMTYSRSEVSGIRRTIRRFRPDVVHVHNVYPSFGPAIHAAAAGDRIPLVMTVHNFRLRCPNGLMFTEGRPCHRCEGGAYWNAVMHDCFASRDQAAAYAVALGFHRFVLRLEDKVAMFLAPSRFVLDRLTEWGVPPERTALVRNFTDSGKSSSTPGEAGLFLGRLSSEKGVGWLLDALSLAGDPPFDIAGNGPERDALTAQARRLGLRRTTFLGRLDRAAADEAIRRSGFLVVPSLWDEVAGLSAMEALAAGRPLVATATGGLPELAGDGRGLLVAVGDTPALAGAIRRMVDEPALRVAAGDRGAAFALAELCPDVHIGALERAYEFVVSRRIGSTIARPRRAGGRAEERPPEPAAQHPEAVGRAPVRPPSVAPATRPAGGARPKVLMIHCYYRDLGGENLSFEAEVALLRSRGHTVIEYTRDNRDIGPLTPVGQVRLATRTVWARDAYTDVAAIIRRERPDIVHVQNTFPLLSPSVLHAANRLGVPVVQAVRNYRLLCASGILYRDGGICHDCVGRTIPLPAVQHACYHGSVPRTSVVVSMQVAHRLLGTWRDAVSLFVAPSEFARQTFVAAGIPAEQIVVKPNFVDPDPGIAPTPGAYALFAGRLALEKGVLTMVEAWRDTRLPPLKIAGDGPIRGRLEAQIVAGDLQDRVEVLGNQTPERVLELMRHALVAVFPSEWYETFGRVAAEAFACGVPVVASRLGAMEEIVDDGVTGRLFTPGDPRSLAAAVLDVTGSEHAAMGQAARAEFEARYTAERNLEQLLAIYERVQRRARPAAGRT